jgi:hypothetical protein
MRRLLPGVLALLGFGFLVAGVTVLNVADPGPADVGWTAYSGSYAPLGEGEPRTYVELDEAYSSELTISLDGVLPWTSGHLVGVGLVVLGLLLFAGLTGWALGRRRG